MTGPSPSPRLAAPYRFALAGSIALLLHVLLLSGLRFHIDEPDMPHSRLTVRLLPIGAEPSEPSQPAPPKTSTTPPAPRHLDFKVPAAEPAPASPPDTVTATDSPVSRPDRESQQRPTQPATPEPVTRTPPKTAETAPTTASEDSKAGAPPSDRVADAAPADVTRISQSPSEQDPYLVQLAVHLAHELERLKIPAIGQLSNKTRMEIELYLMKNGTLTRARVTKSTGIKRIDEAAYRAALAASPYPEPPPDNESQDRFEVELVFSPKRL